MRVVLPSVALVLATSLFAGCSSLPTQPVPAANTRTAATQRPTAASDSAAQSLAWGTLRARFRSDFQVQLPSNDTPAGAMARLVKSYEAKAANDYAGMFTGDFHYEFSVYTDPTLVQMYSAGWFKSDESASSSHLFSGYTPPGGATLPAATSIVIQLANGTPVDDNSAGVDPVTHKILTTRVDGSVTVPQAGSEPLTYVLTNNQDVFYLVRGDVAVGLDASQPADAQHWYIDHWSDVTQSGFGANRSQTQPLTWGRIKGLYR